MDDMIERMKAAIADTVAEGDDISIHEALANGFDWIDDRKADAMIEAAARAVLAAMREPMPEMLARGAGVMSMPWASVIPPAVGPDEYVLGMAYTAMIDAAISYKPPESLT